MPEMDSDPPAQDIYATTGLSRELRQSEIISAVTQYVYDAKTESVEAIRHEFVIVASQDCDLLWDYESREEKGRGTLPNVLLFEAQNYQNAKVSIGASDLWRRAVQNQDERYHYLEACPSRCDVLSTGLPGLIIDFKRFFSLSLLDLYGQISPPIIANRRCRLVVSYREHFQMRAAHFMQRVMLPRPHAKPETQKA